MYVFANSSRTRGMRLFGDANVQTGPAAESATSARVVYENHRVVL